VTTSKPKSLTVKEKLFAAEDELRRSKARIEELEADCGHEDALEQELSETQSDLDNLQCALEKIHYTTPGLSRVLLKGGAHPQDVAEVIKLLHMPLG